MYYTVDDLLAVYNVNESTVFPGTTRVPFERYFGKLIMITDIHWLPSYVERSFVNQRGTKVFAAFKFTDEELFSPEPLSSHTGSITVCTLFERAESLGMLPLLAIPSRNRDGSYTLK